MSFSNRMPGYRAAALSALDHGSFSRRVHRKTSAVHGGSATFVVDLGRIARERDNFRGGVIHSMSARSAPVAPSNDYTAARGDLRHSFFLIESHSQTGRVQDHILL